jgi:ABC-2 type transport system ATP-binding protein
MIDVENLTKRFDGRSVLSNLTFHVADGEVFGYLGPNGAGKTTTLRILLGLLNPTSGRATVGGSDLGTNDHLRSRVGVLLEGNGLYERMTATENLAYYAELYGVGDRDRKIRELLKAFGLDARRDDRVGTYSTGMKRRLGLARAVIHDPDVLFLDEPSAGLDPEAQRMVRDLVLGLSRREGTTVFLNSHDLDEVERVCTSVAILRAGELVAHDTIEHLRSRSASAIVEIVLSEGSDTEQASELVRSLDFVADCQRSSAGVEVTLADESRSDAVLRLLLDSGIGIREVKRSSRSLEDIYLEIVRQQDSHE